MTLPNICYIGNHGVGKRTALLEFLRGYADKNSVPFQIKTKYLVGKLLNSISSSNGTEDADSDSDGDEPVATVNADGKYFPFEVSAIHQGYDVARMSLQDKNYIYTIFKHFHGSSYVLGQNNYHFFVFYHAHLLSEESIIFLQEKLEQYAGCLRIFFTADYPLPVRLADHFLEIQVGTTELNSDMKDNHLYQSLQKRFPSMPSQPAWITWFQQTLASWIGAEAKWMASDVPAIRQWIYFCMQRNLRWCELIEYWTLTIRGSSALSHKQKGELFRILTLAEGGGGWQIIPSYRIPLLWEHLLLSIIKVLTEVAVP
jgi:hypothetical protein